MKMGSATLLEKCAGGVKLPKHGPCPECGARSSEPCPKRAVQDAQRLADLEQENERLRAMIEDACKVFARYDLPEHAFHYRRDILGLEQAKKIARGDSQ